MEDERTLADLLRRHRLAAGLTQMALAERAGLSLRGLSDIERGLRTAPHRDTVERLAEALHLDEVGTAALRQASRRRRRVATVAASPPIRPIAALPVPLNRFLGRDRELAEVRQRLATTGLLTLTGPPGSGKTRLALQIGLDVASSFADGVVFVSLAATRDPELVGSTIAQALGIRDLGGRPLVERLIEYLHQKSVLLVLDNFEQVLAAGPLVSQLLSATSGVKVLVTSREPLRVQGEHEFLVPPLALPEGKQPMTLEAVCRYGAVALFVDRAAAIRSDFRLTDNNARAVVEICRRLDGLPLAIELAAARIRLLSPQELLERLDHRLTLLSGGARDAPARQRTLRATINWSYDLLDAGERALLRRLSVFVGGCTLKGAEAVVGGEDLDSNVLDGLSSLVAKSLLRQQAASTGETRLGMLETIREYGLEQLQVTGELLPICRRHATFYLTLAEEAEPKLLTRDQVHWLRRLEADYDNLRAVMTWSRDGIVDDEIGLRLAGALAWFWVLSGVAWEAREWVEAILARPSAAARTRARARALHAAARIGIVRGDAAAARKFAQESVAIFSELGEQLGAGHALTARASAESIAGDYAAAHITIEQSMTLARQVGDRQVLAHALVQLAYLVEIEGDYQRARPVWEEAAAAARPTGDRHTLGMALAGLAHVTRLRGDVDAAAALLHECLALGTELGPFWRVLPRALGGLAGLAALAGDSVRSARLFGAAESLWNTSGKRDMPWWRVVFDADTTRVRAALGEGPFAEAQAEGRAMRLEEALAYAFDHRRSR